MNHRHLAPLLAAALALAACSSGDDDAADEPRTSAAITTAAPTTAAPTTAAPTTAPPTTAPPTTAPPATAPPTTAPPTTAPLEPFSPIGAGPYSVGVSTVTVGQGGGRPLTVDVWYPLAEGAADGLDPHRYTLLPDVYYESPAAVSATPALAAAGPFPLVVYSHGSGGLRYVHASYTEAVASHGYVVVAADHTGNTTIDDIFGTRASFEEITFNRPSDVARLIDGFTGAVGDAGAAPWVDVVDPEHVAVSGHSFGGFTAVASVTGFANELGEVPADTRVDAIITFAPATGEPLLPDELISTVDVPMLIVVGTSDDSTPIDPNVTRLWDLNDNSPAYRVELVDGEHETFTDLCAYVRFLPTLPAVPELVTDTIDASIGDSCSDSAIDDVRAGELTNTYSIAFLDQVLRDGEAIDVAPPADVVFFSR